MILKAGRITHEEATHIADEGEREEYMGKLKEADPENDRFKAINEDKPFPPMETAWLSKLGGDS